MDSLVSTHDTSESEDAGATDKCPVLARAMPSKKRSHRPRVFYPCMAFLQGTQATQKDRCPVGELSLSTRWQSALAYRQIVAQLYKRCTRLDLRMPFFPRGTRSACARHAGGMSARRPPCEDMRRASRKDNCEKAGQDKLPGRKGGTSVGGA